jgi:flagellar basal-body rod modification protein FlgD
MGIDLSKAHGAYIAPTRSTPKRVTRDTASSTASSSSSSTSSSTAAASSASSDATTADAAASTATVTKDEFMQLLVAQLKYQDPDSPQDPTVFVTQLAQMSALEQATQTNTNLQTLTTATEAGQRLQMSSLVGQNATAKTSSVAIAGAPQVPPTLSVHLPSNATDVKVQITDSAGNTVRTIDLGAQTTGDVNTSWGGLNDKGQALPVGTYNVKVTATGSGNASIDAYAEVSGVVTAVNFGSSGTQLSVAGSPVDPADIISVSK